MRKVCLSIIVKLAGRKYNKADMGWWGRNIPSLLCQKLEYCDANSMAHRGLTNAFVHSLGSWAGIEKEVA